MSAQISTLSVNQLVDLDWSFGVAAASDEMDNVGSTFLKLKLTFDKGGKREDILTELSLVQVRFYVPHKHHPPLIVSPLFPFSNLILRHNSFITYSQN